MVISIDMQHGQPGLLTVITGKSMPCRQSAEHTLRTIKLYRSILAALNYVIDEEMGKQNKNKAEKIN